MTAQNAAEFAGEQLQTLRPGRKLDHSRDAEILDATLELLGEVDFVTLTMGMVATRAKAGKGTVYRRWSSKEELVLDAIERMKQTTVDIEQLPDTGSLRSDLLDLFTPQPPEIADGRMKVMTGLTSMLSVDSRFIDATTGALIEPWADAHLTFMRRAVQRGEVPGDVNIELLSQLVAKLAAYRTLIENKLFDLEFLTSVIDEILLPALHYRPPTSDDPVVGT